MSDVSVRELTPAELPQAAVVLGRGMRDNPLHVRVAGPDPMQRETSFAGIFGAVLSLMQGKGTVLGAFVGGQLVGVCVFLPPGHCRPSTTEKLKLLSAVVTHTSLGASIKVKRWMDTWEEHDPADKPHWHIGPFAVDPSWRRQGVGTALFQVACDRIDAQNGIAYLETDTDANVPFYERFAFKTVGGADVIGIPNWFLQRPARSDTARWARPPSAPQFSIPGRPGSTPSIPTGASAPPAPSTPSAPAAAPKPEVLSLPSRSRPPMPIPSRPARPTTRPPTLPPSA